MKAHVQLAFGGRCREAFAFYAERLGARIEVMNTFGGSDAPLPPGSRPAGAEEVRFAELRIGATSVLGNDLPRGESVPMQGFHVALHVATAAEARRAFDALADGGAVDTPLGEVAWSPAFGIVTDRFGVPWLILAEGPPRH